MDTSSSIRLLTVLLLIPGLLFGQTSNITVDKNGKVKGPKVSDFTTGVTDLRVDGVNVVGGSGPGGGSPPGGLDGDYQVNAAGAFAGNANLRLESGQVKVVAPNFIIKDGANPTAQMKFNTSAIPIGVTQNIFVPGSSVPPVVVAPDLGTAGAFMTGIGADGAPVFGAVNFDMIAGTLDFGSTSMTNNRLLGRAASGNGQIQEINIGTNLSLDPVTQTLNATGSSGGGITTIPIAASIYVDAVNGSSGGLRGRLDRPFQTISQALLVALPGDVIYVGPGTFVENSGFTLPANTSLIGAGGSSTIITSNLSDTVHAVLRWGTNSLVSDLTVQCTGANSAPIGILAGDTVATGGLFVGVNTIGVIDGFKIDKSGVSGFTAVNCTTTSSGGGGTVDSVNSQAGTNVIRLESCQFNSVGTGAGFSSPRGIVVATGTIKVFNSQINISNAGSSSGDNIGVRVAGASAIAEIHGLVITRDTTGAGILADLQRTSGALRKENVSRPDGAAPVIVGTVQEISRYAVVDKNLSDLADASVARANLGLTIGTNVQAWDTQLDSLATLSYTGNALKSIRVKSDQTGFELASGGVFDATINNLFTAPQSFTVNDAITNDITNPIVVSHNTSGTPAVNLGTGILFEGATGGTGAAVDQIMGQFGAAWSIVNNGSRTGYFDWQLTTNAVAPVSKMRLFGSGGLSVNTNVDPGAGIVNANTGFKIANAAGTGKVLKGDGTKFAASTETYAAPGIVGNVLTSDGTNWVSSPPVGGPGGSGTVTNLTQVAPVVLTPNPITTTGTIGLDVSQNFNFTNTQTILQNNGTTNTVDDFLILTHNSTATPLAGFGSGITFNAETSSAIGQPQAQLQTAWSDPGNASRTSYMDFRLANGATLGTRARLHGNGNFGVGFTTNPNGVIGGIISPLTGLQIGGITPAAGKFLQSDGVTYTDSSMTIPAAAGSAGKVLISDGTNLVNSTPAFPNASATSGKMIKSDGTNWVASAETYAAPGTTGNVLTSDGTNWTSAPSVGGGGASVSDLVFGPLWDGVTTTANSKNSMYDYLHSFIPNDDGKVNLLNLSAGGAIVAYDAGVYKVSMGGSMSFNTGTGILSINAANNPAWTVAQSITLDDSGNNSVSTPLVLSHNTTGTPGIGLGTRINFQGETGGAGTSTNVYMGDLSYVWGGVSNATRTSYATVNLVSSTTTQEAIRVFASKALGVGVTTDPTAGYVDVSTGYKINGAAFNGANLAMTDITTNNVSSTAHGFAPKSPADATQFLNGASSPSYAAVKDSDLATTDITTNNVTTSKHGFAPKGDGNAAHYLDGTGAYSTPAGAGGGTGTVTSVGLAGTTNQITITGTSPITTSGSWAASIPAAAQLDVAKLTNLTSTGFVKTSGGDGTLSVDTGSYQPLDSDLTTIAGLTATTDNFIIGVSSAWASRTPAQARTTLGLVIGTNVQAWDADLDTYATKTPPTGAVVGDADAQTLTNKRINPRAGVTTYGCGETTSATSTPLGDSCDQWNVTALASGDTFAAPTGTPVSGQRLIIRIKDNNTPQTLAWNSIYRFSSDMVAPATTISSKTLYVGFIYNGNDTKWDNVSQMNNF